MADVFTCDCIEGPGNVFATKHGRKAQVKILHECPEGNGAKCFTSNGIQSSFNSHSAAGSVVLYALGKILPIDVPALLVGDSSVRRITHTAVKQGSAYHGRLGIQLCLTKQLAYAVGCKQNIGVGAHQPISLGFTHQSVDDLCFARALLHANPINGGVLCAVLR